MKMLSIYRFMAILIFCSLIFTGCGSSQATPTVTAAPSSSPTDIPTEVPVDLAGPEVGSSMVWGMNVILVYFPGGDFTWGPAALTIRSIPFHFLHFGFTVLK